MKARSGVQIFAGARGQAGQTLRRRQKQRTKFSQGGTYDRVVDMASVSNHKWMCAVYMSILRNAVCPKSEEGPCSGSGSRVHYRVQKLCNATFVNVIFWKCIDQLLDHVTCQVPLPRHAA